MDFQRIRVFILLSLFVVGLMLYSTWQQEQVPELASKSASQTLQPNKDIPSDVPNIQSSLPSSSHLNIPSSTTPTTLITVDTDVFKLKIDPKGGDIVFANLPQYPTSLETPDDAYQLLNNVEDKRFYVVQTGLLGQDNSGPDSRIKGRAAYKVAQTKYVLAPSQEILQIPLVWEEEGLRVTKLFTLKRNSYVIDVTYKIENTRQNAWVGSYYGQIKRQHEEQKRAFLSVQMYQGAAVHTADKPYKKVSFKDMKQNTFKQTLKGGWVAMLEHYFLSAWIPSKDAEQKYYSRVDENDTYTIGTLSSFEVPAQSTLEVGGRLYLGPEITDVLKELSPGLELTVDYGILWPISQLLFWLLKYIHDFIGNWGWSIILLTLLIKVVFYKLSAASYKSMAHLKEVQPKIEALKQRCGEDKQQFSQSLIELYRKEKINPLGGCLPILIQIPVFIALYYVLLESVELRQAPFIFWINDLSIKDPYYVLPIIMGASMFFQQRMNPPPPDPMQAKIMMSMPFIFTILFVSFPAGLVLYWVANNLISMLQQWYITRKFGLKAKPLQAKNA
ncbi:membrane protein insertase YidC [Candidatus Berkiella cookevillensis]|uniref:Membrane protein insertase YidC n=1 Tax=Candidatus Berkiella cookevillensis TaxID=437022 RepID=A0A0Q9YE82_9GAMM|nr:membrane protein insertase YidC [Candidatus Berkiella cookevillensis]MCS5709731.1 membrane protein insertase YidC [Candidatus Berkiella cookevillensis]